MSYENIKYDFDNFWSKRKEIRARQRIELENELAHERAELRESIMDHRLTSGDSVQTIAEFLGLKNRNFLYLIINDQPLVEVDPTKHAKARTPRLKRGSGNETSGGVPDSGMSYSIGAGTVPNSFVVTVEPGAHSYTVVRDSEGEFDIPEAWFESVDPAVAGFYRDLVKAVENA